MWNNVIKEGLGNVLVIVMLRLGNQSPKSAEDSFAFERRKNRDGVSSLDLYI